MPVVRISWETAHLHGETWISQHRLRHRLFVERNGWQVPSYRDMEHDQFDTPATQYLVCVDDAGQTLGVVRMLPTTQPYMLKTLWPDMIDGELPGCDSVWEASRLGCDPALDPRTRRRALAELLCAVQEFGLQAGVVKCFAVMPGRLLTRVVVRAGYEVEPLGPERQLGEITARAFSFAVSADILAEVRRRASIYGPVLTSRTSAAA